MKLTKSKHAMLLACLLVLTLSAVTGGTIAWFTDTVESSNNIIASGTLKVTMDWLDGKSDPAAADAQWKNAAEGALFDYTLWEPGYTQARHLRIANVGTLALKYQLLIEANGLVSELADVIDVYYADPAQLIADRTDLKAENKIGTLSEVLAGLESASGHLSADESVIITLALKMQESAGNEYQNLAIGSDFSVKLYATQYTEEEDSFDEMYDESAELPVIVNEAADLPYMTSGNFYMMNDVEADNTVLAYNGSNATLHLNGRTLDTYKDYYSLAAQGKDSVLTIEGDGVVNMYKQAFISSEGKITINGGTFNIHEMSEKQNFFVQNSAVLTINDGTFISNDPDSAMLYCINGFIEIKGGFFQNKANPSKAILDMGNNLNYVNNQKITLSGGTFVNWNPMNSAFAHEWPGVPALIVLADGYEMTSETQENGDIWYTVVPKN